MKNILVAAIFLFSQLGYTAGKKDLINAKAYNLENETFSALFLTKEEIVHLSPEDKSKYLFSMIALAQVLEHAQQSQMGYQDDQPEKKSSAWWKLLVPEAYANGAVVGLVTGAGSLLLKMVPTIANASRTALTAAGRLFSRGGASAAATATAQGAKKLLSKAELETLTMRVKENSKALAKVQAEFEKKAGVKGSELLSVKRGSGLAEANKMEALKKKINADKDLFLAGTNKSEKDFAKIVDGSGLTRMLTRVWNNKGTLAMGGASVYATEVYVKDKTGKSPLADGVGGAFNYVYTSVASFFSGTDASGPAPEAAPAAGAAPAASGPGAAAPHTADVSSPSPAVGPETGTSTKDSTKEKGASCLFGGTPSVWKDFGTEGLKCTRPAASFNTSCKKEEGKFQCPSYGVALKTGSIDSALCIPAKELDDLTVRCGSALLDTVEAKQATLKDAELAAFSESLKAVVINLENNERMHDEAGKTKSISTYCNSKNLDQINECVSIKDILSILKTTDMAKLIQARRERLKKSPEASGVDGEAASGEGQGTQ